MSRAIPAIAALFGLSGVALGAFGAHGLQDLVAPPMLEVWKTAVSYQMYHTPVILLLGLLPGLRALALVRIAGGCFVVGTVVFSGSLYALVGLDIPRLGMITPIGGALLIVGWLVLMVALIKKSEH